MSGGGEAVVAGAGALGLATALALADAGWRVTVCDCAAPTAASGVAAGMLAPVFESALEPQGADDLDLLLAARNLWPELAARAGVALDRAGALAVGEGAGLDATAARLTALGFRPAELGRVAIETLAPGLAPDLRRGLLVREDWRLDPRPALLALRRAAEAAGVAFRGERVTGLGAADALVVATGADRGLAETAPELARLTPVKGQILRFTGIRRGAVCVRGPGAYAVPGADGLAIGATMEAGRGDVDADPEALAPLSRAAGRLFPELAEATFHWGAGVRAATPDSLPMVGPSTASGLVLAVGARRNGWLLAPLVAQVAAACVTGRDPGRYAARLDPARFGRGEGA